ncbi:nuclear transport factor 2 family protein [Achromobacter xylosoxidans]
MNKSITRQQMLGVLDDFVRRWQNSDSSPMQGIDADVSLVASHRPGGSGPEAVSTWLGQDFVSFRDVQIVTSNRVVRGLRDRTAAGAYIFGRATAQGGGIIAFGGVITMTASSVAGMLRATGIQIQINWFEGESALLSGWSLPVMRRLWEPGDAPAAIVSELDAPWHRFPVSEVALTEEEAIALAWYQYAWGLDQADFGLLADVFTEDVSAELTPMGNLAGRNTLVGTLKAFRMPWPWMKHYGEPARIDIDGDTATMILGRIIPGRTHSETGNPLYGAHYQIQTRKGSDLKWRIQKMNYVPGWIEASS